MMKGCWLVGTLDAGDWLVLYLMVSLLFRWLMVV